MTSAPVTSAKAYAASILSLDMVASYVQRSRARPNPE
jgi:hypothetical protein